MGSATAWWLARRGRSVLVLERFEQGHARGSSHGSSRIFRLAYPVHRYVRMAQAALPLWRELEDDAGVELLTTTGGVDHGDAATVTVVADSRAACGAAHELLPARPAAIRVAGHRTGPDVHPDGRPSDVGAAGRDRVVDYVREWLRGLDPAPVAPTSCLYTTTPAEDFVIERHGAIVVGGGFSGHG